MSNVRDYRDLVVWQKGMDSCQSVGLVEMTAEIARLISGLIRSLNRKLQKWYRSLSSLVSSLSAPNTEDGTPW